jgi:protoporphyrinogen/coproporphyrinogen III oxidase
VLSTSTTAAEPVAVNHRHPDRSADVVVVGAGVAGLTVARTVLDRRPQARVVVLEAADRPGGQVVTTVADGYTFEHGATAMMSPSGEVRALLDRLGLSDRVEPAAAAAASTAVWLNGRLNPLPTGVGTAARTGLLSLAGKARLVAEPVLGRREPEPDETIHEFARRRFGAEVADVLIGALVQGVTAGDPRSTGLEAFSPRMWRLDRAAGRGSLLATAIRQRRAGKRGGDAPRGPRPVTLRGGGLGVVVDTLAAGLGNRLEYRRSVRAVEAGTARRLRVIDGAGERIEADTVVLAVPAHVAARLLAGAAPGLSGVLDTVVYTDLRVVGLGYPRTAFAHVPQGFGFLSPPGEGLDIIGATVSSNAFEEQAPPGRVLVRAFAGGVFNPDVVDLDTEAAVEVVGRNIRRVFGARGRPEFVRDVVWRRAIPQYERHHAGTVRRVDKLLATLPGLHVAGNSYRGVGLEDTIRDAARLGRVLADIELDRARPSASAGGNGAAGSQEER